MYDGDAWPFWLRCPLLKVLRSSGRGSGGVKLYVRQRLATVVVARSVAVASCLTAGVSMAAKPSSTFARQSQSLSGR